MTAPSNKSMALKEAMGLAPKPGKSGSNYDAPKPKKQPKKKKQKK